MSPDRSRHLRLFTISFAHTQTLILQSPSWISFVEGYSLLPSDRTTGVWETRSAECSPVVCVLGGLPPGARVCLLDRGAPSWRWARPKRRPVPQRTVDFALSFEQVPVLKVKDCLSFEDLNRFLVFSSFVLAEKGPRFNLTLRHNPVGTPRDFRGWTSTP